jgi:hypothetical protein
VGWFDVRSGKPEPVGEWCWGGLAPLPTPLLCYLDGAHRRMTVVPRADPERRWTFTFDGVPALRGHEIYHPRWTSHPRVFVVTGPYVTGDGSSAVRAGGTGVDVYLVLLNPELTGIESWSRLSSNDRADFYPDARVAAGSRGAGVAEIPGPPRAARDAANPAPDRVVVEARLARIAETPSLRAIAPYTQALVAGRYEVTRVIDGNLPSRTIAVAHWVIKDRRTLAEAARTPGTTFRLTIEPYDRHSELEGERLVMTPDAAALPLFYDVAQD